MNRIASLMLMVLLGVGLIMYANVKTYADDNSITLFWRGPWSATTVYGVASVVSYQGGVYVSLRSYNSNHPPNTSTYYWAQLPGPAGAPGPAGPAGATLPTCTAPDVAVLYNGAFMCKSAVPHYVDNGDGTVTDNKTGLMWEKKTALFGGGVHDPINLYSWSTNSNSDTAPDGTLFTTFLGTLNSDVSSDGTSTCFANHCDWRIPNIVELQGIRLPNPCGLSCFDPIFGPTPPTSPPVFYWSSSSSASDPLGAWVVEFTIGPPLAASKPSGWFARAVRGGR
jgi:hypothetical protein